MKDPLDTNEDLSIQVRRGSASAAARRRLEMYLKTSPVAAFLHQVGCDFDRDAQSADRDAAILERLAVRAQARFASAPRRRMRSWGARAILASALLVAAGGAAAAISAFRASSKTGTAQPASRARTPDLAPQGTLKPDPRNQPVKGPAPPSDPADAAALEIEGGPLSEPERQPQPAPNQAATKPAASTAARSFSEANAARRAGQYDVALAGYRKLQLEHPRSEEALLSHVIAGRLELDRGAASRAAREFGAYLRRAPSGALSEEALQGSAQALRALGDSRRERAAWQELLRRHPQSVHATSAKARLDELAETTE